VAVCSCAHACGSVHARSAAAAAACHLMLGALHG
jgi:hypothetical protein